MTVHDGICACCGRHELLTDDELCPRCFRLQVCDPDDFDADELGLDPEDPYDA